MENNKEQSLKIGIPDEVFQRVIELKEKSYTVLGKLIVRATNKEIKKLFDALQDEEKPYELNILRGKKGEKEKTVVLHCHFDNLEYFQSLIIEIGI